MSARASLCHRSQSSHVRQRRIEAADSSRRASGGRCSCRSRRHAAGSAPRTSGRLRESWATTWPSGAMRSPPQYTASSAGSAAADPASISIRRGRTQSSASRNSSQLCSAPRRSRRRGRQPSPSGGLDAGSGLAGRIARTRLRERPYRQSSRRRRRSPPTSQPSAPGATGGPPRAYSPRRAQGSTTETVGGAIRRAGRPWRSRAAVRPPLAGAGCAPSGWPHGRRGPPVAPWTLLVQTSRISTTALSRRASEGYRSFALRPA